MRNALIAQHVQPPPARVHPPEVEGSRLAGAVALLLAAALMLMGGLLWRENARAAARGEAGRAQTVTQHVVGG
ncbi:MAG: hypothetical protein QM767_14780 [Anaeromyxobacter sp.]